MIPQDIWGLYASPQKTWQKLRQHPPRLFSLTIGLLVIAAIPALSAFYAATFLGWETLAYGQPRTVTLTLPSATLLALALYTALVGSVFAIAYIAQSVLQVFMQPVKVSYQAILTLLIGAAVPVYMSGLGTLYGALWFTCCAFLIGLAYSLYLLYSGTEILLKLEREQAFFYASSVLTIALIILVAWVILTIVLWTNGFAPQVFSS